jgi:hypothetical protein
MAATETRRRVTELTPPELCERAGKQTRAWHDDVPATAYGRADVSNAALRVTGALDDLTYWSTVYTALGDSIKFYKMYNLRPTVTDDDVARTQRKALSAYNVWQTRMRDLRRATERAR